VPSLSPLSDVEIEQCQEQWAGPSARWDEAEFKRRLEDNLSTCLQHAEWMEDTVLIDFIGLLFQHKSEQLQALKYFQQAIDLNSHNRVARSNLRQVQLQIGLPVSAPIPVVNRRASEGLAWWSRAFYHMRTHKMDLSDTGFERALSYLPVEPKLQFYAAKQYLRARSSSHRLAAQSMLDALQSHAILADHPGFHLQVLSESIRADTSKNHKEQRNQVRSKLGVARAVVHEHPSLHAALRPVCDFAGDAFRDLFKTRHSKNDLQEAQDLYVMSNKHAGASSLSSHADHHLALLEGSTAVVDAAAATARSQTERIYRRTSGRSTTWTTGVPETCTLDLALACARVMSAEIAGSLQRLKSVYLWPHAVTLDLGRTRVLGQAQCR